MKRFLFCMVFVISLIFVSNVFAKHLTCDLQDASSVDKYKIDLNGEIIDAGIEKVGEDQVRIFYDIDHLADGSYTVVAAAGNDIGDWSTWSESFEFYVGVPVPQSLKLSEAAPPARISQEGWSVYYVSSEEVEHGKVGALAIDGDTATEWHSEWVKTDPPTMHPHEIQIDLGKIYQNIQGFYYLPRQDDCWNGGIREYTLYISIDGSEWVEVVQGIFEKTKDEQFVEFSSYAARYVSLVALSEVNGNMWATVAELNVWGN